MGRKWKDLNKGEWPDNFIRFIYTDGDLMEYSGEIPHYDVENVEFAIKTINGPTRRAEVIKDYFKQHLSTHYIHIKRNVSECTVREDIVNIAKIIRESANLKHIMEDGECLSDDNMSKEDILALDVSTLDFLTITKRCLIRMNVHTIEELLTKSKFEIAMTRNAGRRVIEDIIVRLESFGLTLRECSYDEIQKYKKEYMTPRRKSVYPSKCHFKEICGEECICNK